jgi:hypothetical protein
MSTLPRGSSVRECRLWTRESPSGCLALILERSGTTVLPSLNAECNPIPQAAGGDVSSLNPAPVRRVVRRVVTSSPPLYQGTQSMRDGKNFR